MSKLTTMSLPVRLTVGNVTTEIGRLTLEPGETVQGSLSALFRAAADAIERIPADDSDDEAEPMV